MKLQVIKESYRSGSISKQNYIDEMYKIHSMLFDYPEFLTSTDIASIRICKEGVSMRFEQPPIAMWCAQGDIRTAPVEALNFGAYEKHEFQILSTILGHMGLESPVFYDIGANAGFYTLGLSKLHKGLRAYAFEPIPVTYALLRRNLQLNGLDEVQSFNFALSNRTGETVFYSYESQSGASSSAKLLDGADAYEVTCRLEKLDQIAGKLPAVDLVKCDVEGAELHVFEGGIQTLSEHHPVIFTEMLRKWCSKFEYHPNAIISLLHGIGYCCYSISGAKIVKCPEVTEETAATNFLFLKEGKKSHDEVKRLFS